MRRVLQTGLVVVVALTVGCESSKTPTGPGKLVLQTSTSTSTTATTTSVIPGLRYVSSPSVAQASPNLPNDMSLFLQPVAGATSTWAVTGVYSTPKGLTGGVKGTWTGPLENGSFSGTLTADVQGCVAEREFSGPVSTQLLQWTGGRTLRDCAGSPLNMTPITLLKSEAPPPTTTTLTSTSVSTTTTAQLCTFALSPTFAQIGSEGGISRLTVSTQPECKWTASSGVDWINLDSGIAGVGTEVFVYSVKPNTGGQRQGVMVIAGIPFFVLQNAK
jgi:hypothetical protein